MSTGDPPGQLLVLDPSALPIGPVEGDVVLKENGMLSMYVNGQWVNPGWPTFNESFTSQAPETLLKALKAQIMIVLRQQERLVDRIEELEEIVGTENRFKNVIREQEE